MVQVVGGHGGVGAGSLFRELAAVEVTATTGPAVASLTGDYFSAADRARIYGLISLPSARQMPEDSRQS